MKLSMSVKPFLNISSWSCWLPFGMLACGTYARVSGSEMLWLGSVYCLKSLRATVTAWIVSRSIGSSLDGWKKGGPDSWNRPAAYAAQWNIQRHQGKSPRCSFLAVQVAKEIFSVLAFLLFGCITNDWTYLDYDSASSVRYAQSALAQKKCDLPWFFGHRIADN